jgi:GNAT superfamily N-acetyltransferase
MPVYASIQRPLYIFDADDAKYAERFKLDSFAFPRTVSDKSLAALKAAGYDGIVYGGYRDAEGFDIYTGRNVEIIAFEPTQIKSAIGNRGTFDPEDPNIMHNPRRRVAPRRALRLVRPPRRVVRRNGLSRQRVLSNARLSPAVAAFAEEWRERDMDKVFEDMGVRVDVLLEIGDYIELELIEALTPGRGDGSRALRALLDLVDKHNLGVTLNAMPFRRYDATASTALPGLDDLVRIYQRFGFRLEEGQDEDEDEEPESYYMSRSPRR